MCASSQPPALAVGTARQRYGYDWQDTHGHTERAGDRRVWPAGQHPRAMEATDWTPEPGQGAAISPQFCEATDNEAECRTLVAAVKGLSIRIRRAKPTSSDFSLLINISSPLVTGRATQGCRIIAVSVSNIVVCEQPFTLL